ncbi:transcription repressor OFP4-like [Telopea speciosissima]|uniref:transcription repressor OFP4-like n=1 Tax=Telopea speciosissima TaxID=54955 RepID=UPI001CC49BE7|nr:transcription repressor OFP4-like [Telopea speciosissima]
MGNYRFRLSDMMPNAWFYKLRDMGRRRTQHHNNNSNHHPLLTVKKQQQQQPFTATSPQNHTRLSRPRNSYYFPSQSIQPEKFNNSPLNPKASDTYFPADPPRRSSSLTTRRRTKRRTIRSSSMLVTSSSSVSAGCNCRATLDSVWTRPDSSPDNSVSLSPPESSTDPDSQLVTAPDPFDSLGSWSSSCSCTVSSSATDIIIDMDHHQKKSPSRKLDKFDGFDSISKLQLRPILTKPANFTDMISDHKKKDSKKTEKPAKFRRNSAKLEQRTANTSHGGSLSVKVVREESVKTVREQKPIPIPVRRSLTSSSPGVKLRANSPRIASKKIQAYNRKISASATNSRPRRKSISDSFAIVKSSFDPQRDFRESMMDMIVENNLRASKDLEELLACYLSLNSNEYHDIIVKVFEQIWFDLTYTRL